MHAMSVTPGHARRRRGEGTSGAPSRRFRSPRFFFDHFCRGEYLHSGSSACGKMRTSLVLEGRLASGSSACGKIRSKLVPEGRLASIPTFNASNFHLLSSRSILGFHRKRSVHVGSTCERKGGMNGSICSHNPIHYHRASFRFPGANNSHTTTSTSIHASWLSLMSRSSCLHDSA